MLAVTVALRPFTRDQLALVEPWFEDPETQRWLGGPDWPRMILDLSDAPLGEFAAGIEPENTASVRCLLSAGFHPIDPMPDWEGVVYYARRRV